MPSSNDRRNKIDFERSFNERWYISTNGHQKPYHEAYKASHNDLKMVVDSHFYKVP